MACWSLFLLLQPLLLAGAERCGTTPVGEGETLSARAPHVMASMASMAADEAMQMDMGAPASTDRSTSPGEGCDAEGTGRSCSSPHMPGGCATMGVCASSPLATVALAPLSGIPASHARTAEPLALPSGTAQSPASPPPRA